MPASVMAIARSIEILMIKSPEKWWPNYMLWCTLVLTKPAIITCIDISPVQYSIFTSRRVLNGRCFGATLGSSSRKIPARIATNAGGSNRCNKKSSQTRAIPFCNCSRNSLTVLRNPSTSGIRARQPKAASLLTSNCFFGVPSGLLASQWISPWNPVTSATASASSRIVRSTPVPTFKNACS